MSDKKPIPQFSIESGKVCPVCKTRTYSRGGIHPQCAVFQADAPRNERIKAERKLEAESPKSPV